MSRRSSVAILFLVCAGCSSSATIADVVANDGDAAAPSGQPAGSASSSGTPVEVDASIPVDASSGSRDAGSSTYRLPWSAGTTMRLTQDCNDSCCNDHVGSDEYAWDWANGASFLVRAARAGTITHLKINSTKGCATTACSTDVNMIVVDHGDGSQAIYMHLAGNTAQPGVTCGAKVVQGQPLAMSGTTGHSTGIHLHFQVSQVHASAPTCECGTDGKQCATDYNPFPDTWVTGGYHTLPIAFEEWPSASKCADRRITMPAALSN